MRDANFLNGELANSLLAKWFISWFQWGIYGYVQLQQWLARSVPLILSSYWGWIESVIIYCIICKVGYLNYLCAKSIPNIKKNGLFLLNFLLFSQCVISQNQVFFMSIFLSQISAKSIFHMFNSTKTFC